MKGLTDIPGILVGHASDYDGLTGCTVILCERGAVAGGEIRGFATGTGEWDLLSPYHVTERIHAVVFAGGSAFGLEAATGVRRFLAHKSIGVETPSARVPLVVSAILYDLAIGKSSAHPTREMGEAAAAAATDKPVVEGAIGAGTGATVGKILGMKGAMKSGIGTFTVTLGSGVMVSALAAVNAVGDVIDPATAKIIAGARSAERRIRKRRGDHEERLGPRPGAKHDTGSGRDERRIDEGRREPPGARRASRNGKNDQPGKHHL